MNTIIPPWLKIVGPIAAVIIFGLACAWCGSAWTDSNWQTEWSKRDTDDGKAEIAQRQDSTEKSNRLAAAQALAATNYLNGVKDGKADADRIIADLRTGNRRLQQRFDGLQCVSRTVSGSSSAGSVSDAASGCGLSDTDVQFLVRFAERADNVARQLTAAQVIIRKYQVILSEQQAGDGIDNGISKIH